MPSYAVCTLALWLYIAWGSSTDAVADVKRACDYMYDMGEKIFVCASG